jgi:hypothetical protein
MTVNAASLTNPRKRLHCICNSIEASVMSMLLAMSGFIKSWFYFALAVGYNFTTPVTTGAVPAKKAHAERPGPVDC